MCFQRLLSISICAATARLATTHAENAVAIVNATAAAAVTAECAHARAAVAAVAWRAGAYTRPLLSST
jgi:hypothetical protein